MLACFLMFHWQLAVLRHKVTGRLSLSWSEVVKIIRPVALYGAQSSGFVTAISEEGAQVHWRTPLGNFWGLRHEEPAYESLLKEQLIDQLYYNEVLDLPTGATVIDVGCHVGIFSLNSFANGATLVVCVEPNKELIPLLKRTFAKQIADGSLLMIEKGAWKEETVLRFNTDKFNTLGAHVVDDGVEEIPVTTIDKLVEELDLKRVDFIKMDIEGSEEEALEGARETIRRFTPMMAIAMEHKDADSAATAVFVRKLSEGYEYALRSKIALFTHKTLH